MRVTLYGNSQLKYLTDYLMENYQKAIDKKDYLVVVIEKFKCARSLAQNKRYWKILGDFSNECLIEGEYHDAEVWHEYFKRRFNGVVEMPDGSVVGKSTRKLKVDEFGEYMQKVEAHLMMTFGYSLGIAA